MSDKKLERFGKYLILDHLVDGGMASICRARYLGEQADKIVAIKMVQQKFSEDPAFKTMFMDEIKVTFGLIHPNIAQTYEYGLHQGQLYTAMEYVDGRNLKEYLDRLKERKFVFPVEISVYIIAQVCQALSYAHEFTDKLSGKKANIIHRDISPHNIMLTFDGSVKVIDFGIAKAETNSEATQAGTIKGKLSYLAPEYLDGLSLDVRYDEFAVGITLWEMLCSRKLFTANNDLAVLKKIQQCKIPAPSSINPNVPKELDQIVLKALSKDRNLRFENMDGFNRALVKFLYAQYPDFNATDLSYFAKELFKPEIKKDNETLQEFGKIDISPYIDDLKNEKPGSGGADVAAEKKRPQRMELDLELDEDNTVSLKLGNEADEVGESTGIRENITRRINSNATGLHQRPTSMDKTGTRRIKRTAGTRTNMKNPTAQRTQTGIRKSPKAKESSGGGLAPLLLIASLAAVIYFKSDLLEQYVGVNLKAEITDQVAVLAEDNGIEIPGLKSRRAVALEKKKIEKKKKIIKKGSLTLSGTDLYMDIYIDGKPVDYSGLEIKIPFGSHKLKIVKDGHRPYVQNFSLTKSQNSFSIDIPELIEAKYGAVSTDHNFYKGHIMRLEIDGEVFEKTLPISNFRIPAGKHGVIIKHPSLGTEKEYEFEVEENKNVLLEGE